MLLRVQLTVAGMLQGDVADRYPTAFSQALHRLTEGILKAVRVSLVSVSRAQVNSLRTTLATAGCVLVGELATTLRHALDPSLDIFPSALLKMASQTKRIVVQHSGADNSLALVPGLWYRGRGRRDTRSAVNRRA